MYISTDHSVARMELVDQAVLDSLNVPQASATNKSKLSELGGVTFLAKALSVSCDNGLSSDQVIEQRRLYGNNEFPESPMDTYWSLLMKALSDTTLLILIAAATVSLIIGALTEDNGWIQGLAIFICVILISNISAGNDYAKQLQFKSLEDSAGKAERCSVLRNGIVERINPVDLVVGDVLVLQVGLVYLELFLK